MPASDERPAMGTVKIVGELRNIRGMCRHFEPQDNAALTAAADWIEAQTRPLTLEECREILNANEYLFGQLRRFGGEGREWIDAMPGILTNGFDSLNLFEAQCLARGFLAKGGAK